MGKDLGNVIIVKHIYSDSLSKGVIEYIHDHTNVSLVLHHIKCVDSTSHVVLIPPV